jgi:hypothetical protein
MLKPCLDCGALSSGSPCPTHRKHPTDRRRGGGHGIRTFRAAAKTAAGAPGAVPERTLLPERSWGIRQPVVCAARGGRTGRCHCRARQRMPAAR